MYSRRKYPLHCIPVRPPRRPGYIPSISVNQSLVEFRSARPFLEGRLSGSLAQNRLSLQNEIVTVHSNGTVKFVLVDPSHDDKGEGKTFEMNSQTSGRMARIVARWANDLKL